MWLLVLVLGLGAVSVAVLTWYVQWRRRCRLEEERLWQQHEEWLRNSRDNLLK